LPSFVSVLLLLERVRGLKSEPTDSPEQRRGRIKDNLRGNNVLLLLDNFDSILHAMGESDGKRSTDALALYEFFRELPACGVT
ncbi:MAG: hypothetical protein ACUVTG_16425, partial [Candidatus Oleimicrobiaceae bacterium]